MSSTAPRIAPHRVVLDCDTANEIDDQFAIAYALGSPALDVRGVISVHNTLIHGSGSVERYQEEAERVVALCGRGGSVPCLRGAIGPMETRETPVRSDRAGFPDRGGAARATDDHRHRPDH